MSVEITWQEVAVRLGLAFITGAVVGLNRGEHARPAGLRTTVLLCLAAAVSMVQANLLMDSTGKTASSFVVLDLMRLPLGILTGVGFIGAGAIWRRHDLVAGVTTAATLWFVTVMGLCFGGGQVGLGLVAFGLCMAVLSGLKVFEVHWKQERQGTLILTVKADGPDRTEISKLVSQADCRIVSWAVTYRREQAEQDYTCMIRWEDYPTQATPPQFLDAFRALPGVTRFEWKPV